jgi:hypothetical protein
MRPPYQLKPMYELEYVESCIEIVAGLAMIAKRNRLYKGDVLDIFYFIKDNGSNKSLRLVDKSYPDKPHITRIYVKYDEEGNYDPKRFLIDALGIPQI